MQVLFIGGVKRAGCLNVNFIHLVADWKTLPAGAYLFKVNNGNTRTMCEICSNLTITTREKRQLWASKYRLGKLFFHFLRRWFTHFLPMISFYFPMKTPKHKRFSDLFKWYRKKYRPEKLRILTLLTQLNSSGYSDNLV